MGHSLEGFKHPFINVLPGQTVSGNHLKVSYFMAKQSIIIKFNRNYLENNGLKSHLDRIIIAITVTLQEGHAISVNKVNWTVCSIVCSPNIEENIKALHYWLIVLGIIWWPMAPLIFPCHYFHTDGSMQERCYSIANALELHLSCINPSISTIYSKGEWKENYITTMTLSSPQSMTKRSKGPN